MTIDLADVTWEPILKAEFSKIIFGGKIFVKFDDVIRWLQRNESGGYIDDLFDDLIKDLLEQFGVEKEGEQ